MTREVHEEQRVHGTVTASPATTNDHVPTWGQAKDRSAHTGTQLASTISDLPEVMDSMINDKLAGIPGGQGPAPTVSEADIDAALGGN